MISTINTMFFSGTGTTRKVVKTLAYNLSILMGKEIRDNIDYSLPEVRKQEAAFNDKDLVIAGVPVYAGRVPNVLLKYLHSINGNGALVVAVVLYGNRNYDDALIELVDILKDDGFTVVAAGAFIGEHSFSKILAKDRPDVNDMKIVADFAEKISSKIKGKNDISDLMVNGQRPYRKYYQPKDRYGNSFEFSKIKPNTIIDDCIDCKLCAEVCPMGSINYSDTSLLYGICIKCCACVKSCPVEAKYFDDENFLKHQHELEDMYTEKRQPELFI